MVTHFNGYKMHDLQSAHNQFHRVLERRCINMTSPSIDEVSLFTYSWCLKQTLEQRLLLLAFFFLYTLGKC
jgi:hypothetical protein